MLNNELLKKSNYLDGSYLYRTFKLKYLPCTDYQSSRIKIIDCNFEASIILGYDHNFNTMTQQAIYHLLEREFDVVGVVSGDKNASPIICCRWTTKELTK